MKLLKIVKYNKNMQKRMNLNINDYIEHSIKYSSFEIEIIPGNYGKFINIKEKENEKYFHIYFDNNKEETKRNYIDKNDKVKKIRIIIDYQIKSFASLFEYCYYVESINFKKFYRKNNIYDMNSMFSNCESLKELNLSNFNTDNVTNMSYMFSECKFLKY